MRWPVVSDRRRQAIGVFSAGMSKLPSRPSQSQNPAAVEVGEQRLRSTDRLVEGDELAGSEAVEGDEEVVDTRFGHEHPDVMVRLMSAVGWIASVPGKWTQCKIK